MPALVRGACAAALTAVLTACALRPPALPEVPRGALEAHLRFLAGDGLQGRMTGTPGYELAAQYVESQFRQLGLAPAGTDGYRQDVPYVSSLIQPERSSLRLHRKGRARVLAWKQDWVANGDALRASVALRAPAVFAGYGVHAPELGYDSYAGLDVRGKVVVVMQGAPRTFAANPRAYHSSGRVKEAAAAERGAVGLLVIRSAYSIGQYPWEPLVRNAGRVPAMHWLDEQGRASDFQPALKASASLSEAAAALLFEGAPRSHAQLLEIDRGGGLLPSFPLAVEVEQRRHSTVARTRAPNVAAVLRGSDPRLASEHVVYTAHLDHIGVGAPVDGDEVYNGAYDNAMGVAVLLETARAFAALPQRPRRSVLFLAVGGEERGLLGSDYYAQHPTVPADSLKANVNLDMPLFLYPLADVVAFGSEHSTLGTLVDEAARAEGLKLAPDPLPDEVVFIRSDQYSFVRRGVPSVFLVSGFTAADGSDGGAAFREFLKTHYHKPSDDPSRPVDWASAQRFTRVNLRIGLAAADADAPPAWHPGNFFGERFARAP